MSDQYTTLGIDIQPPGSGSSSDTCGNSGDDWISIDQPEWVTKNAANFATWLATQETDGTMADTVNLYEQYRSECNGDATLDVEIRVYKSTSDLEYTLTATKGDLSDKSIVEDDYETETIAVQCASTHDLGKPINDIAAACWIGPVYDSTGSPISGPEIEYEGSVLDFGESVWGSLKIKYGTEYDEYTLTIDPQEEETETEGSGTLCDSSQFEDDDDDDDDEDVTENYESTVIAWWAGPPASHEVELPDMIGNCTGGVAVTITSGEGDDRCYKKIITVGRCSGQVLNTRYEEISCDDVPETTDPCEGTT